MWEVGSKASEAVKQFSELGKTDKFDQESQGTRGIYDVFNAPAIRAGTGQSWTTIMADEDHAKVAMSTFRDTLIV